MANKHFTLINGTLDNNGTQDEFHYLQKGFSTYNIIKQYSSNRFIKNIYSSLINIGKQFIFEFMTSKVSGTINTFPIYFGCKLLSGLSATGFGVWYWTNTSWRFGLDGIYGNVCAIFNPGVILPKTKFTYIADVTKSTIQEAIKIYKNDVEIIPSSYRSTKYEYVYNQDFIINLFRISQFSTGIGVYEYVKIKDFNNNDIIRIRNFETCKDDIDNLKFNTYNINILGEILLPNLPIQNDSELDIINELPMTIQDGKSFLNTGAKLEFTKYPALMQADVDKQLYDEDGEPRRKSFDSLTFGNYMNQYYTENPDDNTINQIVIHKEPLLSRQNSTEEIVRKVKLLEAGIGNWIIGTTFVIQ